MNVLNKENLKSILKPFKEKMDSCITEEQLKSELDNYVTEDNATVNNTLSINGDNLTATLSAEEKSVRLSVGDNSLDLTSDGQLLINNTNILNEERKAEVFNIEDNIIRTIPDNYVQNTNIPYKFDSGAAVSIGTDIYILGSYYSENSTRIYAKYNYKYDTTTNTYTKNKDIPYDFYWGSAVAIGTDIYLLGGNSSTNSNTNNYKYDTTTNTYTQNRDIPYIFYYGSAVAIGNDIYLLGGYHSNTNNYKYDITTDTYTKNKDIPYNFYNGSAVVIGNSIYLLGSENIKYRNYNYKYDITTNTYTQMKNIPYDFYLGSAVATGNIIYLFGSAYYENNSYVYGQYAYKYDITNNSYTKNSNIPYKFDKGAAVAVNNNIYLLGGLYTNNYKYNLSHIFVIKPSNHSIYTSINKSYTDTKAKSVPIDDNEYYTQYNGNNIIKNTYPVNKDGSSKIYYKQGAKINNILVNSDTEGIIDINILDYI